MGAPVVICTEAEESDDRVTLDLKGLVLADGTSIFGNSSSGGGEQGGGNTSSIKIPKELFNIAKGFLGIESESGAVERLNWIIKERGITKETLEKDYGITSDQISSLGSSLSSAESTLKTWWDGSSEGGEQQGGGGGTGNQIVEILKAFGGDEEGSIDLHDEVASLANALRRSVVNTQMLQNIYAEAWIGNLIPGAHFGVGVNAGLSSLDITPVQEILKVVKEKGGEDMSFDTSVIESIGNTFAFPTLTADARIGGIGLPIDIGVTAMMFDTTKIDFINERIMPLQVNYQSFGGDIRYAILKGGNVRPKWSIGAGFYYTKGGMSYMSEEAGIGADLNFEAYTGKIETQVSLKALFFVPFAGLRLVGSYATADVGVSLDWGKLIPNNGSGQAATIEESGGGTTTPNVGALMSILGLNKFSAASKSFSIHPQVFGGVGLDLAILNIIVSGSYDFITGVASVGANFRIAW